MSDWKSIEKNLFLYRVRQWVDTLLPIIFLSFTSLWLAQSVYTIVVSWNMFVPVQLLFTPLKMHAVTCLNLMAIFIVTYRLHRTYQLGHERVLRALLFTILGVEFYDAIWAVCNYAVNGVGSFVLPVTSVFAVGVFIWYVNKRQRIVNLRCKRLIPVVCLFLVTFGLFLYSGFFTQWGLYEQGLAADPTGWYWLLNKSVALWMWLAIARR